MSGQVVADRSGMSVCLPRCDDCKNAGCPGTPHTWGSPTDFEHAWENYQDAPGFCGCECGRPARPTKVTIRSVPVPALACLRDIFGLASASIWGWAWQCPGCGSGSATSHGAAVAQAAEHRASNKCRHRRTDA